jgi:diguanylate cyclase (GGDEF)-like protein
MLKIPSTDRDAFLFDQSRTATFLDSIIVLDEKGLMTRSSFGMISPNRNFSDQDYFRAHMASSEVGAFVSKPFISFLSGDLVIAISRRISRPDGSFGGVVVGFLSLGYFTTLFDKIDIGTQGIVSLMNVDGTLVARRPFILPEIGASLIKSEIFSLFPAELSGRYEARSVVDGVRRTFTFRQLGNLPFVLTIGVASSDIYRAWRNKAILLGGAIIGFCAVTAALATLLSRELKRRQRAEAELVRLAVYDVVTGLSNRRALEERLKKEWQIARRNASALSALMVDVDRFKDYNDLFGHLRGDQALRSVALCLSESCRRPTDFVARYGGEEFIILLPNVGLSEAYQVSEFIREAVYERSIRHPRSDYGRLTVSIGVATLLPEWNDPLVLVQKADMALYSAKASGRNRSETNRQDEPNYHPARQGDVWRQPRCDCRRSEEIGNAELRHGGGAPYQSRSEKGEVGT